MYVRMYQNNNGITQTLIGLPACFMTTVHYTITQITSFTFRNRNAVFLHVAIYMKNNEIVHYNYAKALINNIHPCSLTLVKYLPKAIMMITLNSFSKLAY